MGNNTREIEQNFRRLLASQDVDNIGVAIEIAKGLGLGKDIEAYNAISKAISENITFLMQSIQDWSSRKLDCVPLEISYLNGYLRSLNLADNRFADFPEAVFQLTELEVLNVGSNPFKVMPPGIGNLKNLKRLALCHCNYFRGEFPADIKGLENLKELYINNNWQIYRLSNNITTLPNIDLLNLADNRIEILPESIGEIKTTRILRLERNKIKGLPESIGAMQGLKLLYLENNQIQQLPRSMAQLKNLKTCTIYDNPLPKEEYYWLKDALPNCNVVY